MTAANWCPLADDQRHLAHLFDPHSHEDSNVGAGRSALALAQAIIDLTLMAQEAWRTELVESLVFPGGA